MDSKIIQNEINDTLNEHNKIKKNREKLEKKMYGR